MLFAVMVATPCFAQEVEPDGLFSIEGTEWQALIGMQIFPLPWIWEARGLYFHFYGGEVSPGMNESFYIDMLVCSIFWGYDRMGAGGGSDKWYYGILQPGGIGIVFERTSRIHPTTPIINTALLIKTQDNWVPPEFGSIFPNQGEQGARLTDVTITGVNTTFKDGSTVDVRFSPYHFSEIISNIRIISNTEIMFDLDIEADAEIGIRNVTVRWDEKKESIGGYDVFEVLPKTN